MRYAKWIGMFLIAFSLLTGCANKTTQSTGQVTQTAVITKSPVIQSTKKPKPTSTPAIPLTHYPPKTVTDLHTLAAKGYINALHPFDSENVGMTGACPQPKREVTVDPSVTGQQLAEDLLSYFYSQRMDSPCGSVVFAYHNQAESNDAYTAGRISFDVTDSSGTTNIDPNAGNLKYRFTLDIGGIDSNQEYVVKY